MTEIYMSFTEVAEFLGIQKGALANYNMPEPDAYIGRTRGWKKSTIEQWNANRPGHGGRPRKQKKKQKGPPTPQKCERTL